MSTRSRFYFCVACVKCLAVLVLILFALPMYAKPVVVSDLDANNLMSMGMGQQVDLAVGADRVVSLKSERILVGQNGVRTWVGAMADERSAGRAYISEVDGHVYGKIVTPETTYVVMVNGPKQSTEVWDLAAMGMTTPIRTRPDYAIPKVLGPSIAAQVASAEHLKALPTPQTTIDIMVVYTNALLTRFGNVAMVNARINNLIAQANDSYLRSEVAITLRLVRAESTTYTNSNDNGIALNDITTGAGAFSTIGATRNAYAADLVVLLRPFDYAMQTDCGYGHVGGFGQTALLSQYGYSVVGEGSDLGGSGYLCRDETFTHELGHNMGLMHDRGRVLLENNQTIYYGATSYGFGYVVPATNPTVGDIMAYANSIVSCFSSPAVYRQGPTVGLSGGTCNVTPTTGDVLGVPASNVANSADTAAALNFVRVAVSNFRTPPAVTISGTVTNGGPVSGVTFCAKPAAGVNCSPSTGTGAYTCTVPAGWSGQLHAAGPTGFRIKPQTFPIVTTNLINRDPVVQSIGACNLDVDNNGLIEPSVDGVAILRRMMGMGAGSFGDLVGASCAANNTATTIFNATASNYNVTAGTSTTSAARDGMVILRAMQGLTGTSVTNGLGLATESGAANTSWTQLQSWLNTTCGTNF
jgi:Metallo-peptidase family M12B Reprolysin-like